MVGELRAKTDAPMMECKKALQQVGGDIEELRRLHAQMDSAVLRAYGWHDLA